MPAGYACGLRSADWDGSLRLRGRNPSKPSRVHRSARPVRCGPSDLSHFRRGETFEQDLRKNGPLYALMIWTFCFLPTPVTFRGMPAPRLWEFEDARVNFGRVEANPQDLARLLLVEFGLVYGNDWFVIPIELDAGSLCRIGALVVANTFGERMLISSSTEVDGPDPSWRMFALSL